MHFSSSRPIDHLTLLFHQWGPGRERKKSHNSFIYCFFSNRKIRAGAQGKLSEFLILILIIFEGHSEAFANGDVISKLYSERKEGGLEAAGLQHLCCTAWWLEGLFLLDTFNDAAAVATSFRNRRL